MKTFDVVFYDVGNCDIAIVRVRAFDFLGALMVGQERYREGGHLIANVHHVNVVLA